MQGQKEKGKFKHRGPMCSGAPPPCNACIAANTGCVFREDLDRRRKEAIKRKAEDAEHHRDLLGGLLRSIRWSEESDAQHLFRLIRDDAPLAAINASIDAEVRKLRGYSPGTDATIDGLLQLRSEAANLQEQTMLARARRKTMSVEEMSDEPLFRLTAKPWTTVTDDDYLVSHLTSLYFTWWNAFMHPLHEPTLIEAMEKGDTSSLLCSPFLVNAMLALACGYSDLAGAFSDPNDPETWGEHFYDEAKRLWDREEGRASLINLQGLYLLLFYCNMHGKDQLGWSTLSIMVQMYQDLGLARQTKIPRGCPAEDVDKLRAAMVNATWSVFVCSTMFAMFLLKRPTLQPPTVARPYAGEDLNPSVQWRPYPRLERVEPLYGNSLFNAHCDFAEIAYEVALSVPFTKNEDRNAPVQLLHRLHTWHDDLPTKLRLYPEAPGPLFELHAVYYWCALTLSEVSDREPSREPTPPPFSSTSAVAAGLTVRGNSLLMIREMLPMFRHYRRTYGLVRVMAGSCQTAAVAYFILLKALRSPSSQSGENEEALIELTLYLMMGARRWLVYAGIIRMLRPTAQLIGVQLPQKLMEMLDEFDKTVWPVNAHRRIKSVYPNLALVKKDGLEDEEVTMGELLTKWEGLSAEDASEN
ncbi:hypothetical protein A1O7_06517 [Cladophialophora yegresii CBS 114405]|uniref:Xylanolytic transcriptional activator regulatory domain-containing protein n=1 Tax=Cladophialophora yegresii CBS 114405 TaxID=1182544 RepID=W9W3H1_9EURO|nr:uncharacterized protein A1O7_06517 [Cladophialophora yegresii CBS 114405]EXJ59086.1 hypothetical protein A1O7_06517 [Cladophialophora yegresii CBS 114405]